MKHTNKILEPFEGTAYKRGQVVTINGIEYKYSKMVKGKQVFRQVNGKGTFRLAEGASLPQAFSTR